MSNISCALFAGLIELFFQNFYSSNALLGGCKTIWRVGYKLFNRKYLLFIVGLNNKGQDGKGQRIPDDSATRSVVLHLESLKYTPLEKKLSNIIFGITDETITMLSEQTNASKKKFKMCAGGKKINIRAPYQGYGDINC